MRPTTLVAVLALVLATSACGDDAEDSATPEPAAPAATSPSAGGGAASGATVLDALVGTEQDPDAFELSLTDESGAEVTTLPAGDYEIRVVDASAIHNLHLTGAGVEEKTSVPESEEVTWTVTFEAGEYTAVCDPHAQGMKIDLTVT